MAARIPPTGVVEQTGVAYWRARARTLGSRAVISTDHDTAVEQVTAHHRAVLLPEFATLLGPPSGDRDRTVLDLGCGTGRLTPDLAALAGRAIGVEPVPELLAMAEPAAGVEYRLLLDSGGPLPLADGEVDAAFTCLVLGGVAGADELQGVGDELRRVLRRGGLVFLAESVSEEPAVAHWTFRSVADYAAAMPWAGLQEIARFDDAGDAVSVMAGRKPE